MVNKYIEKLYTLINKPDPPYRLFYGTCPDCKKKFKQVVYKRNSKKGYRYEQGIVEDYTRDKKVYRAIRTHRALYIVLPDRILLNLIERKEDEQVWKG